MKKLTKASLDELRKKMPVLNPIEQNSIVGGGKYTAFQPEGGG